MMALVVDGVPYTNFTAMAVTQSIENFAGQFSFSAIDVNGKFNAKSYPIKLGSLCKVTIDGVPVLTGYVEAVGVDTSDTTHSVTISGRDITCDLVDSTMPATFSPAAQNISLAAIINQVQALFGLALPVLNQVTDITDFTSFEIVAPDAGQSAHDYLEKFARKKRVMLTTNGAGAIVITRASGNPLGMSFINRRNDTTLQNNMLSSSVNYDYSQRFSKYIIGSQANMQGLNDAGDTDNESVVDAQAETLDTSMTRTTRHLYIVAENVSDATALKERAEWEANIRMARSRQYSCVIDSHTVSAGKPFWFNRTAMVIDDNAAINETMLIKSVTFNENNNDGVKASIDFVVANAYSLELAAPLSTQDANSIGDPFGGEQLTDEQINETVQEQINESADEKLNGTRGHTGR